MDNETRELVEMLRSVAYRAGNNPIVGAPADEAAINEAADALTRLAEEAERLKAKLAKPDAYWSDVDEETARSDPDEFRDYAEAIGGAVPGTVFWCDPLVKLDREFYGIVPSKKPYKGEWTDGEYYGDTDLVGPFPTHEEAAEAANGITKECMDEYELRLEEND